MKPVLKICLTLCAGFMASGATAQTRYTVSADDQEVTDSRTGLIWRRCAEGMTASSGTCIGSAREFTHEAALERAVAQATKTGKAWRLPDFEELRSISDRNRQIPTIDTSAFPATPTRWFWTSSPDVDYPSAAWLVGFGVGDTVTYFRYTSNLVRLVRAGQ